MNRRSLDKTWDFHRKKKKRNSRKCSNLKDLVKNDDLKRTFVCITTTEGAEQESSIFIQNLYGFK